MKQVQLILTLIGRINELEGRIAALEKKEPPIIGPLVLKIETTGSVFTDGADIRIGSAVNTYGTGKYGQLLYKAEDAEVVRWG